MKSSACLCVFLMAIIASSCNKSDNYPKKVQSFSENFEGADSLADLLLLDYSKWTHVQRTSDANTTTVDSAIVHSGSKSFKFKAVPLTNLSKCDLEKGGLEFKVNETLDFVCWYYIVGGSDIKGLTIFDIEEHAHLSVGPGMRLFFRTDKNGDYLVVERGKMNRSTLGQNAEEKVLFPRDQWVKIQFEALLKQNKQGYVKLFQNDQLIVDKDKVQTSPKDFIYATQGTRGLLNRMQVGITASVSKDTVTMYIDELSIKKK